MRLELYGTYRSKVEDYCPSTGLIINTEGDIALTEFLRRIDISTGAHLIVINGRQVPDIESAIVRENDVVKIFMPVGGG